MSAFFSDEVKYLVAKLRLYTLLSAIGRKPFSRRLPTQSPGDEEAEGAADQVSGDTTSGGAVRVVQEGCICAVDERVARGVRRLAHGGAISSKLGRVSKTSRSRRATMREEHSSSPLPSRVGVIAEIDF